MRFVRTEHDTSQSQVCLKSRKNVPGRLPTAMPLQGQTQRTSLRTIPLRKFIHASRVARLSEDVNPLGARYEAWGVIRPHGSTSTNHQTRASSKKQCRIRECVTPVSRSTTYTSCSRQNVWAISNDIIALRKGVELDLTAHSPRGCEGLDGQPGVGEDYAKGLPGCEGRQDRWHHRKPISVRHTPGICNPLRRRRSAHAALKATARARSTAEIHGPTRTRETLSKIDDIADVAE